MSSLINPNQLATEIMKGLQEYADLSTEDMKRAVKKVGKSVKQDIESGAPHDTGDYAKSWAVKTTNETSNALEITVYSKNRYRITHLLEHGHAKRSGGRIAARPHIAPAEEAGIAQLETEIERSLRDG